MIWDKYGYLTRVPGPAMQARRLPYQIILSHSLDRANSREQARVPADKESMERRLTGREGGSPYSQVIGFSVIRVIRVIIAGRLGPSPRLSESGPGMLEVGPRASPVLRGLQALWYQGPAGHRRVARGDGSGPGRLLKYSA
jgi:hypothetical protein